MNTKSVWQEECVDRLAMLTKLSQQINSSLDLDHVLNAMVKAMVKITDSGFSRLFLWDDELQVLKVRASFSRNISTPSIDTFKPGEGVAGKVFLTGETIVESDLLYQGHEQHKNKDWMVWLPFTGAPKKPALILKPSLDIADSRVMRPLCKICIKRTLNNTTAVMRLKI